MLTARRQPPRVLIVHGGRDWAAPSRLPQLLHKVGCRVSFLGAPDALTARSRFVAERIPCSANTEQVCATLRSHLGTFPARYDWVIVGDEPTLWELAKHRAEPWVASWFPLPNDADVIDVATRKTGFARACEQYAIPAPKQAVCRDLAEVGRAAERIGYPVMLKQSLCCAGGGVRKAASPAELPAAYEQLADGDSLVVQEFLDGPVGIINFLFDRGTPIAWYAAYKFKTWPGKFGQSCVRHMIDHPDVERILQGCGQATQYTGWGSIDFIAGHDGRLRAIEFNPRPVLGFDIGRFAGVNFGKAAAAMLAGQRLLQRPTFPNGPVAPVHMFPADITRCLLEGDPGELLAWLPGAAHHDVPWREPRLIAHHLKGLAKVLVYRLKQLARGNRPAPGIRSLDRPAPAPPARSAAA